VIRPSRPTPSAATNGDARAAQLACWPAATGAARRAAGAVPARPLGRRHRLGRTAGRRRRGLAPADPPDRRPWHARGRRLPGGRRPVADPPARQGRSLRRNPAAASGRTRRRRGAVGPRIKQASQPQRQAGGRGDLDGSTKRGGDELNEPSAGHRFGGGQVPDLAQRFRSRSQDDQRPGHVLEVVQAVRQVHAAHPPGSFALDGRAEQDVADDAVGPARSVVVRGACDGHLEGSRAVGGQQPLGHERANAALVGGRLRGQVLGDGPIHRPVGIQVVGVDQPGPGGGGRVGDALGQRGELRRPPLVGRLYAVVDDRGALAGRAGLGRVGGVGGQRLHALGQVWGRLAADRADPMTAAGQLPDQSAARAAGRAQDHVQLVSSVHGRLLRSVHRERIQGTRRDRILSRRLPAIRCP
jgi:hypothetical protein